MRRIRKRRSERLGPWKDGREDYIASLQRHRIRHLLHYTPAENLESVISSGGLLSRKQQRDRGLSPTSVHGWGNKWKPLEDYICVCFEPPFGLLRREKHPMAALVVKPEVVALRETLYCPMNSAKSWINEEEILSRCDLESFEDLFREPGAPVLKNHESEVLIHGSLPLWAIQSILLADKRVFRRLRRLRAKCWWFRLIRADPLPRWSIDQKGEFFL
jgi:hypothetical protein